MQSLIDNASSGAVITITQDYTEASPLNVNKPLTIIGRSDPSSGARPVITITTSSSLNIAGIDVNASNVTIKGLEIVLSNTNANIDQGAIRFMAGVSADFVNQSAVPVNENLVIDDCRIVYPKNCIYNLANTLSVTNCELHSTVTTTTTIRSIFFYQNNGQSVISNNVFTTDGGLALSGVFAQHNGSNGFRNTHSGRIDFHDNTCAAAVTGRFIHLQAGVGTNNPAGSDPLSMEIYNNNIAGNTTSFFLYETTSNTSLEAIGQVEIYDNTLFNAYRDGVVRIARVTGGDIDTFTNNPKFVIFNNTEQTIMETSSGIVLENVLALTGYTALPQNIGDILSVVNPNGPPPSNPVVEQILETVVAGTASLTVASLIGGSNTAPVILTKVSDTDANVQVTFGSGASLNRLVLVNSNDIPLQKALSVFENTWRSDIDGKATPISFAVKFVDPADDSQFATPAVNQNYTIEVPELSNRAYLSIFRENSDGTVTFVTNAGLVPGQISKYTFTLASNSIYTVADSGVLTAGLTTQVVTKFAELADLYNEDGETHFNGKIYDDADLRAGLKANLNVLYAEIGNLVDAANGSLVTIDGDLLVAGLETEEPGFTGPLTINTTSLVYFVHVLLNETLAGHQALSLFDISTATTYQEINEMREAFIASFKARVNHYFDLLSLVPPTQVVSNLLTYYLAPIQKRARMLAMAALTGTNTVAATQVNPATNEPQTNTMFLRDIDQVWHMYASLLIENSTNNFEAKVNASIPLNTSENMKSNIRLYERTLTLTDGTNWQPSSSVQDPFEFGKRFLSLKASIGSSSQNEWLRKMLQIWNLARIHNNLYDADHGIVSDVDQGNGTTFPYTQPGNNANWNGSTVDPLQLEYYTTFGYGPSNTQLHNNIGFWAAAEEPSGTELYTGNGSTGFIQKVLLDKIHIHLRLRHFAADIRPSKITDSLEQIGWVAFIENFFRYYMWSANNAQAGSPATEETSYIAKKVAFFNAYDASVAGDAKLLSEHIGIAANAAIGNAVSATAFVNALFQVKSYTSNNYWEIIMKKRLNHLPYHVVWNNTENMQEIALGTPIEQNVNTLIATFNNMIDFYPRTLTSDKQTNSLLPDVFEWYKIVGYLAAVPQELPSDGTSAYGSDVGFGRISRTTFPFVGTQTMDPQAFYDELTRRLFFLHKSSGMAVAGSLNSDHTGGSSFDIASPSAVLGVYDSGLDSYVSGFRSLKNLNNYYKMLRQENDLRLAQSNVNSEVDLEDLDRIFTNAISLLDAQKQALINASGTVSQDMIDLTNTLETYHDPYQISSAVQDLQLRYVQLSSENRAQAVLEATYQAFAPLLTAVKQLSQTVTGKQLDYQNLLTAYNTQFENYLLNLQEWNTLIQRAEDLFGGATTYMDLLQSRLDLIASVGALRAKFNADVAQVKAIVSSVQQTYLLLKSQGVRTLGTFASGSTFQMNGVTYTRPRAALGTFSVESYLDFVQKE
jgi:hypothetical protein